MRSPRVNRRDLMKRAVAASMVSVPAVSAVSSCATGGGGDSQELKGEKTDKNPLGVKTDADLEVVIFDGGYDDQYARYVEEMYGRTFPKAEVRHKPTQQIATRIQPRMVKGDPPDVVNNSGADMMDIATLVKDEQTADLTPLLDAPSWDDPEKSVRDVLIPGTVEVGQFGGEECYQLNISFTVYGIWYSRRTLNETLDEEYPRTWDEMLAVCKKAKSRGIAGWTYAGAHPRYMFFTILPMIAQIGGAKVVRAMDNLEPDAWKHDAVKSAFEAYEELVAKGYVLADSDGIDHKESQAEWTKGKALFLPNGSWVENETKDTTPKGFEMSVGATPSLDKGDAMPFGTLYAVAGEAFVVPEKAENKRGGMEFLRMMYSRRAARNFYRQVSAIPAVSGAIDGMRLTPGVESCQKAIEAAGENVVVPRFREWYPVLFEQDFNAVAGKLMQGEYSPKQAMAAMQKASDRVAKDPETQRVKVAD